MTGSPIPSYWRPLGCSGEGGDAPVGRDDVLGTGPAIEHPDDESATSAHQSTGAWKNDQRSAFGRDLASAPSRQSSWNQRTRSAARATTEEPVPVGLELGEGEPQEPRVLQPRDVLLDVGVGAHGRRARPGRRPGRCRSPSSGTRALGKRLCWAPGWSGSRRTMRRVPSGKVERSTRLGELDHRRAFARPRRLGRRPAPRAPRSPMASKIAACTWAFERHDDGEADVACPTGGRRSPRMQPAESARTTTSRA